LVVRFGDDVAKGSPMQESLSSGSRVDTLLRASEHDDALLRASELDINEKVLSLQVLSILVC
jgi:hypothetical protein